MIAPHPHPDERWLDQRWQYKPPEPGPSQMTLQASRVYRAASSLVGKHPIALLAVSISIGALAGCLIKRK